MGAITEIIGSQVHVYHNKKYPKTINFSVHNVKSVTTRRWKEYENKNGKFWNKDIEVITEEGEKITLQLFSKKTKG